MSKCPISVSYSTGAYILIKSIANITRQALSTDLKEDAWLNLDVKRRKASENVTEVCVSVYVCVWERENESFYPSVMWTFTQKHKSLFPFSLVQI